MTTPAHAHRGGGWMPGGAAFWTVLALALGLRVLVVVSVLRGFAPDWFFHRGMEMGLVAQSVLDGHGLASPFGGQTGPTAFIAPAYPLLAAAIFKIFGSFSRGSEVVVLMLQLFANLVTIALLMQMGRRFFGERAALLAGLLWACSPPLLWMPTIFWETSISIALLTGLLALVSGCRERPSRGFWMLLGAYCGVAVLFSPAMLLVDGAVVAWLVARTWTEGARDAWLALLLFLMVFSAWPARNWKVFHAFVPLRTTVGYEMWMGNREGATGYLEENLFPTFNGAELAEYVRVGEIRYTQDKNAAAWSYIKAHPAESLRLTGVRIVRFWTGTGTRGGAMFYAVHACFTTLLGITGLALLWRRARGHAVLLSLPLLLFPLPYYITHAEFRYRLGVDALLTLLAGYALAAVFAGVEAHGAMPVLGEELEPEATFV